jgi:peroxiredoxin Q/BCP
MSNRLTAGDTAPDFTLDDSNGEPVSLSDYHHSVAESWGAWGEKNNYGKITEGLIRSTIVVDADRKVSLAQYNVRAKGHVDKLRRNLGLD